MKRNIEKRNLLFTIIPKVVHPWFDEVNKGAIAQAEILEEQLGIKITIEYLAPETANINEQNSILEKVAATDSDGIAIDPLDNLFNMKAIVKIKNKGIPIIVFDSPSPEASISSVGNNFTEQGEVAAKRLVRLIGGRGSVGDLLQWHQHIRSYGYSTTNAKDACRYRTCRDFAICLRD